MPACLRVLLADAARKVNGESTNLSLVQEMWWVRQPPDDPPRLHSVNAQETGQLAFREVPLLVDPHSQELVPDGKGLIIVRVRSQT